MLSNLFEQEINHPTMYKSSRNSAHHQSWVPPDKDWIRINADASRRYDLQSTTIARIIRDTDSRVLTTYNKKLGNCPILIAECEVVRCAILAAISMGYSKVYINTDSQIVVNAVKGRIPVPKYIINLVEDIRRLCLYFKNIVLNYCCREDNKDADVIAKKTHFLKFLFSS